MKSEHMKILDIVCELISNSLNAKSSEINASIKIEADRFTISVKDNGIGMNEEKLKQIRRVLNQPQRDVYEEYYSGLARNLSTDSGLNIIGFLVDQAQVESSPEGTTITIIRKQKRS